MKTINNIYISINRKGNEWIEIDGVHVGELECEVAGQCRIICNDKKIIVIMDVNEIRKE